MTHRCLLFLQQLDFAAGDADQKSENAFFEEIESMLGNPKNEIEEYNEYEDMDFTDFNLKPDKKEEHEHVEDNPDQSYLMLSCGLYRDLMKPFLDVVEPAPEKLFYSPEDYQKKSKECKDQVEILRYYLFFIETKFHRALSGKNSGDDFRFHADHPKDSDASAKVAMISVDRCRRSIINLWDMSYSREHDEVLFQCLALLDQIKKESLREFPGAPYVIRPGFDR